MKPSASFRSWKPTSPAATSPHADYLKRMQEVLKNSQNVIIDPSGKGSGVVPYLPLPEVQRRQRRTRDEQAGARDRRRCRRGAVVRAAERDIHRAADRAGVDPAVRQPGRGRTRARTQFKVPFIQNVEFFDRRILDLDPPVQEVLLSDQKRINVDAFARSHSRSPAFPPAGADQCQLPADLRQPHQLGAADRDRRGQPRRPAVRSTR